MWGALEDTRRDADLDYKKHSAAAQLEFTQHRLLGIAVVIVTTIVGTSVFGALTQNSPNPYVQIGTGILSIFAAVLSAIQTFYSFEGRSRSYMEYAMECYAIKRQIDAFFQRYPVPPIEPKEREQSNAEQRAIDESYANARAKAPIIPLSGIEAARQSP